MICLVDSNPTFMKKQLNYQVWTTGSKYEMCQSEFWNTNLCVRYSTPLNTNEGARLDAILAAGYHMTTYLYCFLVLLESSEMIDSRKECEKSSDWSEMIFHETSALQQKFTKKQSH